MDYVDVLLKEYILRKSRNERYSERAFARSLGLSPGYLKLLFQGKKRLSVQRAKEVAEKIGFSFSAKKKFVGQVINSNTKNSKYLRDKKLIPESVFTDISDWYHFALIELLKIVDRSTTIERMAKILGLSKTETRFAIANLERSGLVIRDSLDLYTLPDRYEIPSIPSEGIRKYHRQVNELSVKALDSQPFENREFRGLTLKFDRSQMTQASKEIEKFVADFDRKFGAGKADSVYQLAVSFFKLNKEEL